MPKTITKTWEALMQYPHDLPPAENGDWVVMTAEIPATDERGGDIVRVKGMRTPAKIPLLAQHMHVTADGSPPVLGSVVEFRDSSIPWKKASVPAKLGRFEWAKTELAQKYKSLWREHINTVSIGAMVHKAEPISKDEPWGGMDYTETELFELSIVTVPANPAATTLAAIQRALGDVLDIAGPEDADDDDTDDDLPLKEFTEVLANLDAGLAALAKQLGKRLDDLEAKIVVAADERAQQHDRKPDSISIERLRELLYNDR